VSIDSVSRYQNFTEISNDFNSNFKMNFYRNFGLSKCAKEATDNTNSTDEIEKYKSMYGNL
jgi:hypothetical protein